jgi:hypothetical protein
MRPWTLRLSKLLLGLILGLIAWGLFWAAVAYDVEHGR